MIFSAPATRRSSLAFHFWFSGIFTFSTGLCMEPGFNHPGFPQEISLRPCLNMILVGVMGCDKHRTVAFQHCTGRNFVLCSHSSIKTACNQLLTNCFEIQTPYQLHRHFALYFDLKRGEFKSSLQHKLQVSRRLH